MKIGSIKIQNIPQSFKSQNSDKELVLGYDDEISKKRREEIRKHFYENTMPYQSIYETEKRLDDFEMGKLLEGMLGKNVNHKKTDKVTSKPQEIKPNKIDEDLMYQVNARNTAPIEGMNSWRGSTAGLNNNDLELMKKAGIKTIVTLSRGTVPEYMCKDHGLDYYRYLVDVDMFSGDAFKSEAEVRFRTKDAGETYGYKPDIEGAVESWNKDKRVFIDEFVKFIQVMQKDNVYVGCNFGSYKTNYMMMLNYFFNPKLKKTPPPYIESSNRIYIGKFINLVKNLTDEDKAAMGWTEKFEKQTINKINASTEYRWDFF